MKNFPNTFVWGAATASFQIEGGAYEGGRGESIWDRFCRIPGKVRNGDTGDVACNHYHLYKEDIQLMKELGLQSYRFSVAWPRILPNGTGKPNQAGLDFYKRLLHSLLEQEIMPALTLYHWDLPQVLQDKGGWTNRDMVGYYQDYAAVLFQELGDLVPMWITHNEPWVVSYLGYGNGEHAPGYTDVRASIKASHHLLLSHGEALTAFREMNLDGQIGITLNLTPTYPAFDNPECRHAARIFDGFNNRWYLDPVLKGAYPSDMIDLYGTFMDLDFIQSGDLQKIGQPSDFLGINYYSMAACKPADATDQGQFQFLGVKPVSSGKPTTGMGWEISPQGLYDIMKQIQNDYGNIPLYITENGAAYDDYINEQGEVNDDQRLAYIKTHLEACHQAIQDGIHLKGYYSWSLLDNFEWAFGYEKRFGMVHVDFETQKRTPKKSALWYKEVIANNGL